MCIYVKKTVNYTVHDSISSYKIVSVNMLENIPKNYLLFP